MRNVWRLFADDIRRARSNTITIITIIGLIVLPSIFSWYNMLACWNVFDNTGNLTVAVANCDEGYASDLVPVRINVGDRVTSALRENGQLNWVFTTKEDAVDGARSGRYYAAVVIPESFSRDMLSFYSDEFEHASITYYSNEKKNAVAPKVTDQGADRIYRQINATFTETLSEIALGIASALVRQADETDLSGALGKICDHLKRVGAQMGDSGEVVALYAEVLGSSATLIEDAGKLITDARDSSATLAGSAADARATAEGIQPTIADASDALSQAIATSEQSYAGLPDAIGAAFDSASNLSADAAWQLRDQADAVDVVIADYQSVINSLDNLAGLLDGNASDAARNLSNRLAASVRLQTQLRDSLRSAADDVDAADAGVQSDRAAIADLAEQAREDLESARADYDQNLAPTLAELGSTFSGIASSLSDAGGQLDAAAADIASETDDLSGRIGTAQGELEQASAQLVNTGKRISKLGDDLSGALASGDQKTIRAIVGSDPQTFAQAVSAPVQLERNAVFPVENFGSAMSPLYTTLALWIGALLIMVTLKPAPSPATLTRLNNPSSRQVFLGRFGIVAVLSLAQSTMIAAGNLLFLGVQAVNPLLYLVCFWVAGLVFAFIIYTLVALFANFGKALSVILLIVQVSGGGGSFPMQLLPTFFQDVSPYLPITHAVRAMRAAMFGVYAGDYWIELGQLVLFVVPFIVLGIALHAPLSRIVPRFVAHVEKSKLM